MVVTDKKAAAAPLQRKLKLAQSSTANGGGGSGRVEGQHDNEAAKAIGRAPEKYVDIVEANQESFKILHLSEELHRLGSLEQSPLSITCPVFTSTRSIRRLWCWAGRICLPLFGIIV